jgi:hypothetical protein
MIMDILLKTSIFYIYTNTYVYDDDTMDSNKDNLHIIPFHLPPLSLFAVYPAILITFLYSSDCSTKIL